MQKSIVKQDAGSWARIEQVTVKCSPQKAKIDDNLAFTVGFHLDGVVRRNFHQKFWEAAYDQHDAEGFIRLNALRLRTLAQRRRKLGR